MLELAVPDAAYSVRESEYHRLLGYPPGHEVSERSVELGEATRAWYRSHGRPWWYARQLDDVEAVDGGVRIDRTIFRSSRLRRLVVDARADTAFALAVSAGRECEDEARRQWLAGRPDEYFFMETFSSAVVEALIAAASYQLCEWADRFGLAVLPHYSPGYPEWEIADQEKLLGLVVDGGRIELPGELRVLDTGMLSPKKSLLAAFGVTRHGTDTRRLTSLVPCETCSLGGCRYRRAPYRRPLPWIEGVGMPQRPDAVTEA